MAPGPRPSAWALGGALGVGVEGGALPQATAATDLVLWAERGPLRLEASALAFLPQSTSLARDQRTEKSAVFSMLTVIGRGCALATYHRLRLGPCAAAGVVWMNGRSIGVTDPAEDSALWGGIGMDGLALLRLTSRLGLRLRGGVMWALDRPSFVIATGTGNLSAHRPSATTTFVSIGAELRFF